MGSRFRIRGKPQGASQGLPPKILRRFHGLPGTPERPGLVLGLDRGGACSGVAYRIAARQRDAAARYLDRRELAEDIYLLRDFRLETAEGALLGYALVVDRTTPYYAGSVALDEEARRIATCAGERGANRDYLEDAIARLEALGIRDSGLAALRRRVRALGEGNDGDN